MYLIWVILLILMWNDNWRDKVHMVEGTYSAFLYFLVSLGFCFYGTKLLMVLKKQEEISFITKRIFILTVVCTILFMVRSVSTVLNEFLFDSPTGLLSLFGATLNDLICELLPIAFILAVLCWPSHKTALTEIHASSKELYNPILGSGTPPRIQ